MGRWGGGGEKVSLVKSGEIAKIYTPLSFMTLFCREIVCHNIKK